MVFSIFWPFYLKKPNKYWCFLESLGFMPVDDADWQNVCLYFTHTYMRTSMSVTFRNPPERRWLCPAALSITSKACRQAGGSEGVWACVFLPESSRFQSNTVCLSKQGGLVTYWSSRQKSGDMLMGEHAARCSSGIGLCVSLRVMIWQKKPVPSKIFCFINMVWIYFKQSAGFHLHLMPFEQSFRESADSLRPVLFRVHWFIHATQKVPHWMLLNASTFIYSVQSRSGLFKWGETCSDIKTLWDLTHFLTSFFQLV